MARRTTRTRAARPRAVPARMTKAEWQTRVDLAAAYQLFHMYGWTDMAGTHISARVPGPDEHFLLNPYGMLFDEITASSLIKVDVDGHVIGKSDYPLNPAGFVLHSAVHIAAPHLTCVMHSHSPYGAAVSSQEKGLLPINQKGAVLAHWVRYHDYEGVSVELDERDRLVKNLGDGRIIFLRNHGLITVGESIGAAFMWMWRVEFACRIQIMAQAAGGGLLYLSKEAQARTREQGSVMYAPGGFAESGREWPALIRQLERERGTSYKT